MLTGKVMNICNEMESFDRIRNIIVSDNFSYIVK